LASAFAWSAGWLRTTEEATMIQCEPTKRGDQVKVTFVLPDGVVTGPVAVVGDFNGWNPGANPMKHKGETLLVSLTLTAGRKYRFRYLTEGGRWLNDPNAHGVEQNQFGDEDSVIDLTDISQLHGAKRDC
jgi:1,4-alpha-glucan branching enzyme